MAKNSFKQVCYSCSNTWLLSTSTRNNRTRSRCPKCGSLDFDTVTVEAQVRSAEGMDEGRNRMRERNVKMGREGKK